MRDGCYIIGRGDRRVVDRGPPPPLGERRETDGYIELPDPTVCHCHAQLLVYRGAIRLIDLGSARGTHLVGPEGRERIYEAEVTAETVVEFGRCRRRVAELLAAAERRRSEAVA